MTIMIKLVSQVVYSIFKFKKCFIDCIMINDDGALDTRSPVTPRVYKDEISLYLQYCGSFILTTKKLNYIIKYEL